MVFFIFICKYFGDANLPPQKPYPRFWINLIFLNSLAAYALFFLPKGEKQPFLRAEWVLFVAAGIFLCLSPPIFSGDLHEYMMRGRILGVYHQNPYLTPGEYPNDPFWPLSTWTRLVKLPENYGPLWASIQWIVPTIFGQSYLASIFFFKFFLMAFLIGAVFIFSRIARLVSPNNCIWMLPFFALNPNLINQFLIDGHNDIVMIFLSLCAFYLLLKGRYYWAVAAATLAVLVKFTTIILLPAMGIYYCRKHLPLSAGAWVWAVVRSAAVFGAITFLFYLPFWVGPQTVSYFSAVGSGWFYTNSVPYAFYAFLERLHFSVSPEVVRSFFIYFFIINCLAALTWLALRKTPTAKDLCRAVSWMFLAMYLGNSMPFYGHHLLWAFPFLILAEFPAPLLWNLLYTSVGLFFYFKRPSFLLLIGLAVYGAYLLWIWIRSPKKAIIRPVLRGSS